MQEQQLNQIRERIHRTSIHISEVSEDVKTRFKKLALDEFRDDYGLALKWLVDCGEGLFADRNDEINAKIDILADELKKVQEELNQIKSEKKEQPIRTLSGRTIGGMRT
jgi:hypothetical protein